MSISTSIIPVARRGGDEPSHRARHRDFVSKRDRRLIPGARRAGTLFSPGRVVSNHIHRIGD